MHEIKFEMQYLLSSLSWLRYLSIICHIPVFDRCVYTTVHFVCLQEFFFSFSLDCVEVLREKKRSSFTVGIVLCLWNLQAKGRSFSVSNEEYTFYRVSESLPSTMASTITLYFILFSIILFVCLLAGDQSENSFASK